MQSAPRRGYRTYLGKNAKKLVLAVSQVLKSTGSDIPVTGVLAFYEGSFHCSVRQGLTKALK